ncbi:hypothetical protein [Streptomyces sp. NPDC001537]
MSSTTFTLSAVLTFATTAGRRRSRDDRRGDIVLAGQLRDHADLLLGLDLGDHGPTPQ